jgi:Zn-dependent peptidase ImmA (M78 family)
MPRGRKKRVNIASEAQENDYRSNTMTAANKQSITDFKNILRAFSKIYAQLENVKLKTELSHDSFQGYCVSEEVGEFTYAGKMRMKNTITQYIAIDTTNDPANVLFTFLHEMAHAITPYCERKVKNTWVRLDHSDRFYKNFFDIMEIAFAKGFVNIPYTMRELKKKDEMDQQYKSDMKRFGS